MIIDAILDRRDVGIDYTEDIMRYMYKEATLFEMTDLARALDCGENADIQRELCRYIDDNKYDRKIKRYIKTQNWVAVAA